MEPTPLNDVAQFLFRPACFTYALWLLLAASMVIAAMVWQRDPQQRTVHDLGILLLVAVSRPSKIPTPSRAGKDIRQHINPRRSRMDCAAPDLRPENWTIVNEKFSLGLAMDHPGEAAMKRSRFASSRSRSFCTRRRKVLRSKMYAARRASRCRPTIGGGRSMAA
jgi:putative component of membrane protein insertase Oxa1/YidC/SpoIIIJ protein YidD